MASEPAVIEWSRDPTDSRLLLALGYVPLGVAGGLVFFVVSMLLFAAAVAVAGGNLFAIGLIALLTLVGGPFSLLYLWPLIRHPEQRPPFPDWVGELRPRWVVLASLVGALAIALSIQSEFGLYSVVAVGFMPLLVIGLFSSEGAIDTETRTLRYGDSKEIELDGLTGVKRLHVGETTLLWLSFPRGRSPRLLVLPAETDRAARPVFEAAAAQPTEANDPNRTVQATLVALAVVFLGVPAILVVSGSVTTEGVAIVGYVAAFFGILFVGAAAYGT
jgi:hypothetical protein